MQSRDICSAENQEETGRMQLSTIPKWMFNLDWLFQVTYLNGFLDSKNIWCNLKKESTLMVRFNTISEAWLNVYFLHTVNSTSSTTRLTVGVVWYIKEAEAFVSATIYVYTKSEIPPVSNAMGSAGFASKGKVEEKQKLPAHLQLVWRLWMGEALPLLQMSL